MSTTKNFSTPGPKIFLLTITEIPLNSRLFYYRQTTLEIFALLREHLNPVVYAKMGKSECEKMAISKNKNQKIFNELWHKDSWTELRDFLFKWLQEEPDYHWILLHIAETLYQEELFNEALDYAEKAFRIALHCPLAMWEYAEALDMVGRHEEAAVLYKKLIRKGVNRIFHGACGEGIMKARMIVNDSRYTLGIIYAGEGEFALAEKYVNQYISNRRRKYESRFSLRESKKDLAQILRRKNPRNY
jgi:tetratricopeptide (TPR) repeat protein